VTRHVAVAAPAPQGVCGAGTSPGRPIAQPFRGAVTPLGHDFATVRVQRDLATPPPRLAPPPQPDLTDAQIRTAMAYNRERYDEASTRLIQRLLGGPVTGDWTEENIVAIAATQEEYGLFKDGRVGHETLGFLDREQRLERVPTTTPNCLVSFRVVGPDAPIFRRLNATQCFWGGHFQIEAEFSNRCDCSQFEYRQFIRGHLLRTRGGVTQDIGDWFARLPAGRVTAAFQEDGDTTRAPVSYGHRDQLGSDDPDDHYVAADESDDQASGCRYEAEDFPGGPIDDCEAGDVYDVQADFRGEIQRSGRPITVQFWTAARRTGWRP